MKGRKWPQPNKAIVGEDLGVSLNKEQLDVMYDRFTEAADHKKGLRNDEIEALAKEVVEQSKGAVAK